jgi:hypothetical protein
MAETSQDGSIGAGWVAIGGALGSLRGLFAVIW